jgi:hypothetical protein
VTGTQCSSFFDSMMAGILRVKFAKLLAELTPDGCSNRIDRPRSKAGNIAKVDLPHAVGPTIVARSPAICRASGMEEYLPRSTSSLIALMRGFMLSCPGSQAGIRSHWSQWYVAQTGATLLSGNNLGLSWGCACGWPVRAGPGCPALLCASGWCGGEGIAGMHEGGRGGMGVGAWGFLRGWARRGFERFRVSLGFLEYRENIFDNILSG